MTRLLVVAAIALTLVTSSTGTANADYRKGLQLYYARDFAGALAEWRAGAEQGDIGSQYAIGTLYERGEGVAKDDALALEWIQRAAEGGFAMAQYHLATIYRIGRVVARDYVEAVRWYRAAAEKDLKESQSDLGLMYENGFGVEKDLLEAVHWYKIAAAQGYPAALAHIARLRVSNPDVVAEADRREAERLAEQRSKSKPSPPPATKSTGATKALPKSAEAGSPKAAPPADEAPASKAPDQRKRIVAVWTRWSDKISAQPSESASEVGSGGTETLSIAIPRDWSLAATDTLAGADFGDDADIHKLRAEQKTYLPRGQTKENWTDAIIVEQWRRNTMVAPHDIQERFTRMLAAGCGEAVASNVIPLQQRGNISLMRGVLCERTRDRRHSRLAVIKVIESKGAFHVTVRALRDKPIGKDNLATMISRLEKAQDWLTAVVVSTDGQPARLDAVSSGTGFYVSASGHILTNEHVVDGCRELRVAPHGAIARVAAKPDVDLALLKVPSGSTPAFARFSRSAGTQLGETVVTAGFPLKELLKTGLNVSSGIVSALAGFSGNTKQIQITAPIQPGNSGGPLFDQQGAVVGVIVATLARTASAAIPQNVNFAIKSEVAQAFMREHGVEPSPATADRKLEVAEIASQARAMTVSIECWK